jgi:hypothetical protein
MTQALPASRYAIWRQLLSVCALAIMLSTASAAQAAPATVSEPMHAVPETGTLGLLSLTSSIVPLDIPWLMPGDTFSWQIGLHLKDQPLADGSLEFIPDGGLIHPGTGYQLTAQRCETQWSGKSGTNAELTCASGARTLMAGSILQMGPAARLGIGEIPAAQSPHILFTLSLPEQTASSGPFTFALGVTAMGNEALADTNMPHTGFATIGLLSAAFSLLAAGFLAKVAGRKVLRR